MKVRNNIRWNIGHEPFAGNKCTIYRAHWGVQLCFQALILQWHFTLHSMLELG